MTDLLNQGKALVNDEYLFLLLLGLSCFGCPAYDPPKGTLTIYNRSDSAIYVYQTCGESIGNEEKLELFLENPAEMTDEKGNKIESIYSPNYRINAYSYGVLAPFGSPKTRKLPCNSQSMNLFFISEAVIRKYTWDTIVLQQLYQKKVQVTNTQLDSLGWRIKYVP